MIRHKSFDEEGSTLYLVATPIGNLSEMSPRAIEILQKVDVIACEDTRTSGILLQHFGIQKRLLAYQNFNEEHATNGLIALLEKGLSIALISDAGYPLINDPGQRLVPRVIAAGFCVVPISGPSAFLNALVASGHIVQPFLFVGFLPPQQSDAQKRLEAIVKYPMTLIFYEAPHRLYKMLETMYSVFGERKITIARELTKRHEEFIYTSLEELLASKPVLKGEMVVVVEGYTKSDVVDVDEALDCVGKYVEKGYKLKEACGLAAKETGLKKNELYALWLDKKA